MNKKLGIVIIIIVCFNLFCNSDYSYKKRILTNDNSRLWAIYRPFPVTNNNQVTITGNYFYKFYANGNCEYSTRRFDNQIVIFDDEVDNPKQNLWSLNNDQLNIRGFSYKITKITKDTIFLLNRNNNNEKFILVRE